MIVLHFFVCCAVNVALNSHRGRAMGSEAILCFFALEGLEHCRCFIVLEIGL